MANDKERIIVGLDIGTSVIRVVIGELNEETGKLEVIGTASKESGGINKGSIVNIEKAKEAIREAIETAEYNAGATVESIILGIGGSQIEGKNSRAVVPVRSNGRVNREITIEDVNKVIENATEILSSEYREKLHVIPQDYIVDGTRGVKDPVDMMGTKLEVEVHIITEAKTVLQNIKSCIARAGYFLDGVMLNTLAQTQSVCHQDEMDLGSILIDLGAGTTDALVLIKGAPISTTSVQVGGNLVTNDISVVLGIPIAVAEKIKIDYGCCWTPLIDSSNDKEVILPGVGGRAPEVIMQSKISEIIQARVAQIFTMIKAAIVKDTKDTITQLSGNIILTGGGAQMEGVVELAQAIFKTSSVRVGVPEAMGGVEEEYRKPEFATAVGLISANQKLLTERGRSKKVKKQSSSGKNNEGSMLKRLFKSLF
ncbi:MAG: cell division protein FtsA [Treponema bryantii]|nr:cell division protein FtsA [Treponema bryantii]